MAVCSKILTATDISTRLEVTSSWLNYLFPAFGAGQHSQELVVEDENGAEWKFVLCIRRGRYGKPYISQATWLPFVVEKQAKVGDEVEFTKETDGATGSARRYKIRVIKKVMQNERKEVKIFGATIGYRNN